MDLCAGVLLRDKEVGRDGDTLRRQIMAKRRTISRYSDNDIGYLFLLAKDTG